MKFIILFVGLVASVLACGTAYAQWQFSGTAGARQVRMVESDRNGRQLVEERGVLPGVELHADYAERDWRVGVAGEIYGGNIAYDGRVQSGAGFATDTKTEQIRFSVEGARNITETTLLIVGIERDYWRRDILGRGTTLGMDEKYNSWRLLTGVQARVLQAPWADVSLKGLLIASSPEKLAVRFDNQLFDQAELATKSGFGARMSIGVRPAINPNIRVDTDFEWMRIGRSDDAILSKGDIPVGLVAQPEHVRKAFGIKINYRF